MYVQTIGPSGAGTSSGGQSPVQRIHCHHTPVRLGTVQAYPPSFKTPELLTRSSCLLHSCLCSGYSQEVVCYTLGNIPQMPSAPRLVRAGVTWITLQWSRPEGCSPEEVITYTLDIQEDENVSLADCTPAEYHDTLLAS